MTKPVSCSLLNFARRVGVLTSVRAVRQCFLNRIEVITYHRIGTNDSKLEIPSFLKPISVKRFAEQISFLARTYEIISLDYIINCIYERKRLPDRAIAITFDDGYRDNYENAFPILKKNNISATIFLTAGCIEDRQILWWDEIHRVLLHCQDWQALYDLPSNIYPLELCKHWKGYDASSIRSRMRVSHQIVAFLKSVSDNLRLMIVNDLPKRLKVRSRDVLADDILLSWDQVREMTTGGISFGAHTLTHPCLDRLDSYKLKLEVEGSKSLIELRVKRPVHLFSYPGGFGANSGDVHNVLRKSGFRGAVTNKAGSNTLNTDPFQIGRRSASGEPIAVLAASLLGWFDMWRVVKSTINMSRHLQE